MTAASESDFRHITNELGPDELQRLFHNLSIPMTDIECAERNAYTTDTRVKARVVLDWWRRKVGAAATRIALFEAKRRINPPGIHRDVIVLL